MRATSPDPRRDADLVWGLRLAAQARRTPERTFALFPDSGRSWTWREADEAANGLAGFLHDSGVRPGDRLGLLLPGGEHFVQCLLAASKLGAVATLVNQGYRGAMLHRLLRLTEVSTLVVSADMLERVEGLAPLPTLQRMVVVAGRRRIALPRIPGGCGMVAGDAGFAARATTPPPVEPPRFRDPAAIIFTSGTTGPSKAVLCCYGQFHAMVETGMLPHCSADDVWLIDIPMFHVGGLLGFEAMLLLGGTVAVCGHFHASTYWDVVREHGVTGTTMLPTMEAFLLAQPPSARDRDHRLRKVVIRRAPSPAFRKRFDVPDNMRMFNMSEISSPLITGLNPPSPTATGRPRPGVQVRIVDADDIEVAEGEVGELILRTDRPWEMSLGYAGMPEATVAAWRNGWFHTGDAFRRDAEGWYHFVDRLQDVVRRRGENVSSWELEQEVAAHPAVERCAVIGVPGIGDEEIKVCLTVRSGHTLDPAELIDFLRPRVADFMLPRYVEICPEMETTPSMKVKKEPLRAAGITAATWDREAQHVAGRA